jgi:hypothetical protein
MLGIIGLTVAAASAHAAAPTEVTLFGQKYTLERHSLGGKYANGLSVTQASSDDKTTTARFVQGDTPAHDRLYVGCFSAEDASLIYDQFYLLTGADASGNFNQTTSNLTQYFGGAVDFTKGGRISGVTWISDVDTGKKQDLNIALQCYTGDDHLRFYDEDTLNDDYISDAIVDAPLLDYGGTDTNMPYTGVEQGAVLADGNVLFIGRQDPSLNEGPQLGIFDIKNKKFFPVLTNVGPATMSQKIPYDTSQDPFDLQALGNNEYLILGANPLNRGADRTQQILYKAIITPPANPATAGPESIKVQIEAAETLLDVNATPAVDALGVGVGGIVAVTAGREVAPKLPRLYFTDRGGELITATPVVSSTTPPAAGQ